MNLSVNPTTSSEACDLTNGLLASISHDLRTPLSAILLWTKVLSEQRALSPQELNDGLQSIRECVEEQLTIVEDLVDSARIATGRIGLKKEPTDLVRVLSRTVEECRQLAAEKALELREDFDPALGTVLADPQRLKQLAGGMLVNAIGRSPRGTTVEISGIRHGDIVEIFVCDTGERVNGETIRKILERFPAEQSPLGKRTTLYTAAKLARLLGGGLDIHSEPAKTGARCTLTLDLPRLAPSETESDQDQIMNLRPSPQELIRCLIASQPEQISARA